MAFGFQYFMANHVLNEYFAETTELKSLMAHASLLTKLQRVFAASIPEYLEPVCRVANLKQGVLILYAAHSAAATKLKQLLPSLHETLMQQGFSIIQLQVRIQPDWQTLESLATRAAPPRVAPPVPTASRHDLGSLAAQLPRDNRLRSSLERLLKRSR
jgi:hypothetical protein